MYFTPYERGILFFSLLIRTPTDIDEKNSQGVCRHNQLVMLENVLDVIFIGYRENQIVSFYFINQITSWDLRTYMLYVVITKKHICTYNYYYYYPYCGLCEVSSKLPMNVQWFVSTIETSNTA